jgi:hypothetical protein
VFNNQRSRHVCRFEGNHFLGATNEKEHKVKV